MPRFHKHQTPLPGLLLLERLPLGDERGYLERIFCEDELGDLLDRRRILQINHTLTRSAGTVRGLHFQRPPHAEMKVVSCLAGEVFDVALDLRQDSPTFLQWHGEILSAKNHHTLVIPEGFAHGFQTMTPDCEMLYLHTAAYQPKAEDGVDGLDPSLEIAWPLPVSERSSRDRHLLPTQRVKPNSPS